MNPVAAAYYFTNMVRENFPNIKTGDPTDNDILMAKKLYESFVTILQNQVLEYENGTFKEGRDAETLSFYKSKIFTL